MKSTNYLIRISILSTFLFVSSFLFGQCPIGIQLSSNGKCLQLWWSPAPSPLPTPILFNGISYTYVSGAGTIANKAIYSNDNSGNDNGCNMYSTPTGTVTITIGSTVCTYANGTLPLNISNFSTKSYQNEIQVVWSANEPEQCIGYELEKSFDGKNWNVLTFKSNSTPNSTTLYSYIDNQKSVNTIYYRLKKINKDNSMEYSNTITYLDGEQHRFTINPNPATNEITLVANHQELINNIKCFDLTGKTIGIQLNSNNKIDISELLPGVYYQNIETTNNTYIQKFIKSDNK